jgi:pentatricopeptide repeat protein
MERGELHQLFLADQAASGPGGGPGQAPATVGWGGQPIAADSNAARVPWFGRRRGAPQQHRLRSQARPLGGAGEGGNAAASCPSSVDQLLGRAASSSSSSGSSSFGQDVMSVEEIVALLRRTPRADPVPPRVYRALHHLDSRTVALLLKDSSKAGLDGRTIELFDWLRALPERNTLRALCDVYTYTAMISLCIYQQNVERAMELLGEMRARGVERNVHTYTALMNVCIKCGKLPAALDIFATMKREGCTPNVVTFNTLIDVYGKLTQWDQAVGVLAMMRAEVRVWWRCHGSSIVHNGLAQRARPDGLCVRALARAAHSLQVSLGLGLTCCCSCVLLRARAAVVSAAAAAAAGCHAGAAHVQHAHHRMQHVQPAARGTRRCAGAAAGRGQQQQTAGASSSSGRRTGQQWCTRCSIVEVWVRVLTAGVARPPFTLPAHP